VKRRLFPVALILIAAVFSQRQVWAQTANTAARRHTTCTIQNDEIQVFASFLKENVDPHAQTVLVTKTEATDVDVDSVNLRLATQGRGIPSQLRADFKAKNKSSCLIERFAGVMNLTFVSTAERDRIFRTGWDGFHKRYGKTAVMVVFSRVAFNSDKTLALFNVSTGIDRMAAGGTLYLLEKKDGKWSIKSQIETWTT
jgi:hypothetical protein